MAKYAGRASFVSFGICRSSRCDCSSGADPTAPAGTAESLTHGRAYPLPSAPRSANIVRQKRKTRPGDSLCCGQIEWKKTPALAGIFPWWELASRSCGGWPGNGRHYRSNRKWFGSLCSGLCRFRTVPAVACGGRNKRGHRVWRSYDGRLERGMRGHARNHEVRGSLRANLSIPLY